MVLNTEWAQVEVIDLINDGSGLAFGIIGGRSTGVVVKTILPGGVADRDGRLQSGDHILQIGEVNLRGLGSEQVASVLRQCGVHVRMVVARPIECANSDYQTLGSQAPIVPTKILGDPVELDRHLIENGYAEAFAHHPPSNYTSPYIYTGQHTDIQLHGISGMVEMARDPKVNVPLVPAEVQNSFPRMLPLDMALHESNLPETETYVVELRKDDLGLGITVAGYVCEKEEISGIFVKSISKGSAADLTNNIKVNDRIVEVDGISVIGFTNHQAVELLRKTGPFVTIKVERYLRGPKYEQLQQAIRANELRPPSPPSPTISSLPKVPLSLVQMDYLNIEPDGESRTSFEFDSAILLEASSPVNEEKEIVIGGEKRSVQFSIASHESIYDKWREKLDKDVEIVIAQMQKESTSGLGISLEGTVDVEDGKEVRPHHYIRNILPDGPVGKNGILQSGDELLEVNGIQLLGLNHLEVVSILKQLPNFVSIVCARYPVPIRIIDTSQHREAFQARKILAGSLQTLIPTSESSRLVKAKSETSIASSLASEATASRSRSLELIAGLPMWNDEPTVVELNKGDHGLGFSILDYQDPLNPQETVIVIRSLVPGGVAQTDGRLIPGDRLLGVNDINVEHATLDMAVQVLKGVPKGIVRITVAKPLNANDAVSHASQDTEEDQTCLEDFQECIEEYQECLEVVHICIDEENSFNHSPCTSQVEDFGQKVKHAQINLTHVDFLENNYLNVSKSKGDVGDSDIDISYKSTNENYIENLGNISVCNNVDFSKVNTVNNNQNDKLVKADSFTQSDKPSVTQSSVSEKDGYETCIDDSLSEENIHSKTKPKQKQISFETELKPGSDNLKVQTSNLKIEHNKLEVNDNEDLTPTNSKVDILDQFFVDVSEANVKTPCTTVAVSEPCLNVEFFPNRRHLCLDTKLDDGLKSYDNQSEDLGGDEFFLVQYPTDVHKEVCKSMSEPNVLETYEIPSKTTYKRCLTEYYNDYADCIEAYRLYQDNFAKSGHVQQEMCDDDIFNEILLPFKSRSAPDIMDRSFVMLTYDPGPDLSRRKSAFVPGYQCSESEMTVIRPIDTDYGTLKGCHVDEMLQKHWGSTHTVKVFREPNKSLGISIVGGKVDLHSSEKSSDTLLGIFVKNVVPNSPAGKTGQFKTGDRILEVSGIDLRQASHETAVEAIRNATNPVTFVVQSLIPWKSTDTENNSVNNESNCPSPFPSPVSVAAPVDIKELEFRSTQKIIPVKIETKQSKAEDNKNIAVTPNKSSNQKPVPVLTFESTGSTKTIPSLKCQSAASPLMPKPESELIKPEVVKSPMNLLRDNLEPEINQQKLIQSPVSPLKEKLGLELNKEEQIQPPISPLKPILELELTTKGMISPKTPSVPEAVPSTSEITSGDEKVEPEKVISRREDSLEPSDEDEDEDDIRELEGRTVSAEGQQIDRASAANVRRSKEEIEADPEDEDEFGYTMNKVKKKYANLGHTILMVQLERSSQGLGLSLAGHKDRNCMAVFVCGLNPNGAAYKTGGIQIGDEILEVNGVVLHGRCHLNASAIIKGLSGPIFKVIILRRKTAIDDIAVKPITQFPISLAEEASEEQFSASYPNVRTIAIKKGNQSLGIMIIEGKHAEVGQGIFISDIQEGSSAEKAGLEIGEMILAVNKDSLVGSNYDTAANLLKRTEGLVTLVVSNPGKKESVPSPLPTSTLPANNAIVENNKNVIPKPVTLKPVAPHSRPTTPVPEPVADPLTCPIIPGKEVTVEVVTDNKGLGIFFIGGKDTQINNGIVMVEIYPGGTIDKDGRLQPGDQILEVNGTSLKDVTNTTASQALRQTLPKMKMSIYRPNNIEYSTIEVDLIKKPGKGLGLSVVARKSGKGVYIADVINGGTADLDGRIVKGDLLISVNGQNIENSTGEEAGAILKTVTGRVSLKLRRYKPTAR